MKFIKRYIEDILVLGGLTIIVLATFLLSKIAGLYATGVIMFGLGVYFSKYPLRR
ncbi:hypothetical protein [Clostridium tepidiprofundi]|uniref:hypothetical protein n=1 Tax=Clostridium tepidiprofundi TaxID=420412 RepID=UPI000A8B6DBA|nr:hypothetical protein [Clostridium tepidiprofundi]